MEEAPIGERERETDSFFACREGKDEGGVRERETDSFFLLVEKVRVRVG